MSYGMEGPCVGRIGPGVSLYVGGEGGGGQRPCMGTPWNKMTDR